MISNILIRPSEWWLHKIPISITTVFLLLEGKSFSPAALVTFIAIIVTVSGVANFGYALNDLFDQEEDLRIGRTNASTSRTPSEMWKIITGSAIVAFVMSIISGGLWAGIATGFALCLPLAYSIPPLRIKERGWFGVYSDALAAHVFPAVLAIIVISRQYLSTPQFHILVMIISWSVAVGLRGILSHQLISDTKDRAADLTTVVHVYGHKRISQLVLCILLPIETILFYGLIFSMNDLYVTKIFAVLYILIELIKLQKGRQPSYRFTTWWKGYIPFANGGFYKVWGPFALGLDLMLSDPWYAVLFLFFICHSSRSIRREWSSIFSKK